MHAHPQAGRWPVLATLIALLLWLAPATVLSQGIKDAVDDDPATEEPFDPAQQAEDWEAAGLIDDRSYESPQFGYTLDWSRDWAVDAAVQELYGYSPVSSDEDIEQDIIYLLWTDSEGAEAYAIFSGQTANRGGPEGEVEEWTDPDYIESQWDPEVIEVEVLLDDTTRDAGAVLYSLVDVEDPAAPAFYSIYQSLELEDGTTIYLTFSASEDVIEDAYESWANDLEFDGAPLDLVFDWEDIEAAM